MTNAKAQQARLLFLVSNDFGELANALFFIGGCGTPATLLLPERLWSINRQGLPVPTALFRNPQDVDDAVSSWKPDIVFLFSGYLYAVNRVLCLEQVEQILDGLRRRGCRVVTTDPFLGILSRLDGTTFHRAHPQHAWLTAHFARVAALLGELTHLYPFSAEAPVGRNSLRCFSDAILRLPHTGADMAATGAPWLLVLAAEDYLRQCNKHGRHQFHGLLATLCDRAATLGRDVVLIAPQPCLEAVNPLLVAPHRMTLQEFCSHAHFLSLLSRAEYVFWWNMFSHSVAARLLNRQPGFFLDGGHLGDVIHQLPELGIRCYFAGAAPTWLDAQEAFRLDHLARLAAEQDRALRPARDRIGEAPRPDHVVQRLLEG